MSFPEYKPPVQEGLKEDLGRSGIREKPKAPADDSEKQHQELQDLRTEEHQESLSMLEKYREKIFGAKKESPSVQPPNKFARMVMVALGLHAIPLAPEIKHVVESLARQMQEAAPKTVLHPQSLNDMLEVEAQKNERSSRIDVQQVAATKKEMREQIARGEEPSLKDEYFTLERENGVDGATVERGKKHAEEQIKHFFALVDPHQEFDPNFLRQFVNEMYGPNSNYEWSQASVAKYFDTGKRNCVAVAKGEAIVFEGLLQQMDPEVRKHYEIGIKKVKQHEIATLTYHADDGKLTSYELEGGIKERDGSTEEAGSKVISLKEIKKSMVAEKPTVVKAADGKVAESPALLVVTDQPVDDGIVVEGDLKGADFVMEEAKREGLKPEIVKEVLQEKPMELEILSDRTTAEEAREAVQDVVIGLSPDPNASSTLSLRKIHNPSFQVVETLEREMLDSKGKVNGFWIDELNDWSPEAVERLLLSPVEELNIRIESRKNEDQLVKQICDAAEGMSASAHPAAKRVVLGSWDSGSVGNFSNENFNKLLDAFDYTEEIEIGASLLLANEFEALKKSHAKKLDLSSVTESNVTSMEPILLDDEMNHQEDGWRFIQVLHAVPKEVVLDGSFYVHQLYVHPELAGYKNIQPNFHELEIAVLGNLLKDFREKNDPGFREVEKRAQDEMNVRASQGYQ